MLTRIASRSAAAAVLFACLTVAAAAVAAPLPAQWIGLYAPGAPGSMAPITAAEAQIQTPAAVVNFFVADSEAFPSSRCRAIAQHGSTPLVTLEFWSAKSGGLGSIIGGSRDAYLRSFADAAKAYGGPVLLRPFHEMNGDWYPWGATGSNTPAKLVAAYRHVHDIFAEQGATNVEFVWCPNVDFAVASYYPGDSYVDYAAIDGYNNGKPWRSFSSIFGKTYAAIATVSSKPIFIAETSCVEGGAGKAAWIADMFARIGSTYPRITGVCWFDAKQTYDWRIGTSTSSLAALRAGFSGAVRLAAAAQRPAASQPAPPSPAAGPRAAKPAALPIAAPQAAAAALGSKLAVSPTPKPSPLAEPTPVAVLEWWSFRYAPDVCAAYCV